MSRLFVALDLPDAARDRLVAIRPRSLRGARLVSRQDLHLTLHFLGETEDGSLPAIRAALAAVKSPPFRIDIEGVGNFPEKGETRVLWAGVRTSAALTSLHRTVADALAGVIGFVPEERPYHPHITLALLEGATPREAIEDYLDEHAAFRMAAVPMTRFCLYSSSRKEQGQQYEVEASFDLS